jgi:hypothetical protein
LLGKYRRSRRPRRVYGWIRLAANLQLVFPDRDLVAWNSRESLTVLATDDFVTSFSALPFGAFQADFLGCAFDCVTAVW